MIQEILVIVSVAGAVFYIGRHVYAHHFSSKKKCDGCVINKVYQAKIDSQNR